MRVEWPEQPDPATAELRATLMNGAFENVAARFNGVWALPHDLVVRH